MSAVGDNEHEATHKRTTNHIKGLWRDAFRALKTPSSTDEPRSVSPPRACTARQRTELCCQLYLSARAGNCSNVCQSSAAAADMFFFVVRLSRVVCRRRSFRFLLTCCLRFAIVVLTLPLLTENARLFPFMLLEQVQVNSHPRDEISMIAESRSFTYEQARDSRLRSRAACVPLPAHARRLFCLISRSSGNALLVSQRRSCRYSPHDTVRITILRLDSSPWCGGSPHARRNTGTNGQKVNAERISSLVIPHPLDPAVIDPVYETLKVAAETRKRNLADYLQQRQLTLNKQTSLNSQGSSEIDIQPSPRVSRHTSHIEPSPRVGRQTTQAYQSPRIVRHTHRTTNELVSPSPSPSGKRISLTHFSSVVQAHQLSIKRHCDENVFF